jgi:hypothetical protein
VELKAQPSSPKCSTTTFEPSAAGDVYLHIHLCLLSHQHPNNKENIHSFVTTGNKTHLHLELSQKLYLEKLTKTLETVYPEYATATRIYENAA